MVLVYSTTSSGVNQSSCFLSTPDCQERRYCQDRHAIADGDTKPPYFHLSVLRGGRLEIPLMAKQLQELFLMSGTAGQTAGWIGFFQAGLLSFSLCVFISY